MKSLLYEQFVFKGELFNFMFLHLALWCDYATSTKEMHTFHMNTLIQFLNFWRFLCISNLMGSYLGRQLKTRFLYVCLHELMYAV